MDMKYFRRWHVLNSAFFTWVMIDKRSHILYYYLVLPVWRNRQTLRT